MFIDFYVAKRHKKDQKKKDIIQLDDPKSLVREELVVMIPKVILAKLDDGDEPDLSKILEGNDGIRKIGNICLTFVESNEIKKLLINCLLWDSIRIEDLSDVLPEYLFEFLKEKMSENSEIESL